MNRTFSPILSVLCLAILAGGSARAGHGSWTVGLNFAGPGYYRPWYPGWGCYYQPYYYPNYYCPAPIVVQAAPVPPVYAAPTPVPMMAQPTSAEPARADIESNLQLLANPDERVRIDSVLQLGRARAQRAIDPLAATLAGDRSPAVREAAARALGLIGTPQGLPALQRAAQLDSDKEVRNSARFAVDIIQTRY